MNLPNKLTLSRIILVPVFMLLIIPIPEWIVNSNFLNYGNYMAAVLFFWTDI